MSFFKICKTIGVWDEGGIHYSSSFILGLSLGIAVLLPTSLLACCCIKKIRNLARSYGINNECIVFTTLDTICPQQEPENAEPDRPFLP